MTTRLLTLSRQELAAAVDAFVFTAQVEAAQRDRDARFIANMHVSTSLLRAEVPVEITAAARSNLASRIRGE